MAAAVAEFTDLWQKGKLEEKDGGGLLSSMVPADLQVAKLPGTPLQKKSIKFPGVWQGPA